MMDGEINNLFIAPVQKCIEGNEEPARPPLGKLRECVL
jgi:hypothetical protein